MADTTDNFSAGEQALGYLYQVRYALLQMIRLPEDTACFIERDDDLDFTDPRFSPLSSTRPLATA